MNQVILSLAFILATVGNGVTHTNAGNVALAAVKLNSTIQQDRANVIKEAKSLLGMTEWVDGGTTPYKGMDCSGFTQWVYKQRGIVIPRTAQEQYNYGIHVSKSQLQPGDLVFFTKTDPSRPNLAVTHAGMYIGNGNFIEESSKYNNVLIQKLFSGFYAQHYYGACRVIQ